MIKFYVLIMGTVVICALVYLSGVGVGGARCRASVAIANSSIQVELIKKQGGINAETYNRGSSDIRQWLRAGYTIAE